MNTEPVQGKKAERLAVAVQRIGIAGLVLKLKKSLGFSALLLVMAVFFIYLGVPWYFGAVMVILAAAVIGVEVMAIKKAAAVKPDTPHEAAAAVEGLEPGEHLVDTIPAVMQYRKTRSAAVLGTGQVLTPENALLITDKAIWALTVPLPGADKVVAGTDIGKWQWMNAWRDIADKLQEMLDSLPLEEALKKGRAKRLLKLEELKKVKTIPFTFALCFVTADGRKYGYSIRVKEDYERAKELFKVK